MDISDALSEKDKVKFTIHTKVRISLLALSSFKSFLSTISTMAKSTVVLVFPDDSSNLQQTRILGRSSARGVRLVARQIRGERRVCRHRGEYFDFNQNSVPFWLSHNFDVVVLILTYFSNVVTASSR